MATKNVSARASVSPKKKPGVGAGVKVGAALAGAAAVAAAGYYFFYGSKEGVARRKKVTAWSKKMKTEVIAEARALKALNKRTVGQIAKRVSKAYSEVSSIDRKDLELAVKELEQNWEAIKQEAGKAVMKKVSSVGKQVKKAAKKAVK